MIHLSCLQPAAHADDWLAWKVRGMLCPSPEGTRQVRTRSRETRLAARSILTCRTGTPREAHSPQIGGQREGHAEVSERSRSWIGSLCHPVQSLSDGASHVLGVAAAPPPPAPPSCLSHLPMWPSSRHAWPPSRSVRQSRSVGEAGLGPRERCRQGVAKEAPEYPPTSW